YWRDVTEAARQAAVDCEVALKALQKGVDACLPLDQDKDPGAKTFETVLESLANANEEMAQHLYETVRPNIDWLRTIITQHVSFASAGNVTHFDPAELLSAIAVVERWRSDFTEMEARDALKKALEG